MTIVSFVRAMKFQTYYWVVLQYGFAFALVATYWMQVRKIAAAAKEAEDAKKDVVVKSESLLSSFNSSTIQEEPVYENNVIV